MDLYSFEDGTAEFIYKFYGLVVFFVCGDGFGELAWIV
ncbi:hypothetical protein C900_00444 [Fulvivirga imtechensis AK7]|uniref:Cyclic nucleotide-binding domain-containing protein n=1 Tax=Fulvivirga imtechensis AK7 TaxID=1237149 RepID=L8JHQ5_9BACT|nr:hypothetical protein C900_00444 [Fulvivirga imtechensis AK7]